NEQGLIVERTIAMRPFPAVKLFRDAMHASLKDKLPPDVWDYPNAVGLGDQEEFTYAHQSQRAPPISR
ncbi:MAG TPA: hypothetical protein VN937_21780, partial [Blastocatellia bacterium]|nr:hypothetical protein [Blastocatellia bacterium]